jgi:flavin-dependent dehydrogenase
MYDAIIVGARCAGSTTAMLLARKGYRVLLLDKATFPSDTISTHIIHPIGLARLKRWGLLDQIISSNCPPISQVNIDLGPFDLQCSMQPVDGVAAAYAPRRYVLDKILVDAAVAAGAELREGFQVQDLLRENDQIVGVKGRSATGELIAEKARMVIGADSKHSLVARQVGAKKYHDLPALTCLYYSYWSNVPISNWLTFMREGCVIGAWPTNNQLTLIGALWPIDRFPAIRTDAKGHLQKALDLVPDFAELVRAGKQEDRLVGTSDLPNFFRKAFGPGWALVGDAGRHEDPILAHGISNAFLDAELLTEALDDGFSERRPLLEALQSYQQQRDAMTLPFYEQNSQAARLAPPSEVEVQVIQALRANPTERTRYLATMQGSLLPGEFFSPQHISHLLASAQR